MKKIILKYFIVIFFINFPNLFSQETLEEQYQYCLKLFNEEKFFDAITEAKRLNYFDKEKVFAFNSDLLIGKAYKEGGKFSEALEYFTLAEINSRDDSSLFLAKIFEVRVNILRRTTDRALKLLDQIQHNNKSKNKELYYWKGWTYIFADEWDKASLQFELIDSNHPLKMLCDRVNNDKYNIIKAKILSYILPGLGQFYTGHYFSGLLSLGWNILLGYFSVRSFVDERIFDGFVITNFLWMRFYTGNVQNAEKFANEENLKIENNALYYLQFQWNGEKP